MSRALGAKLQKLFPLVNNITFNDRVNYFAEIRLENSSEKPYI